MEDELRRIGYCSYCKSAINSNESYVVDPSDNLYHLYCYNQDQTTDDMDNVSYYEN
jgi:hypothetical protein